MNGYEAIAASELLRIHRQTLLELKRRNLIRTANQPQGDWAELLVATAYGGQLAPNSAKSHDVVAAGGRRLQVKARAATKGSVSAIRSFDFDALVVVLLNHQDLTVDKAVEFTPEIVKERAVHSTRRNCWVLTPSNPLLLLGLDVTDRLRSAANQIDADGNPRP